MPEEFLDFKLAYPERAGAYNWQRALRAIHARLKEGYTWEEITAGATRYAAYCRAAGKFGTEYVMQPSTFCGPDKSFELEWTAPTAKQGSFDQWHAEAKRRADPGASP